MLGQPADFDMWFSRLVYTGSNRKICTEVKVVPLTPLTADHNLTIYLTEDSVVDWQLNSDATPPDVPDYVHRHVLRTNLNGSWGAPIGTAAVGDTLTFTYSGVVLAPSWNPAHCALLGYVYNTASYEVMQVAERGIEP
ncbi:MAG TPA: Omp28-related outer membrane protein, partial [Flavobacteriales bacterium]|nr:Omp28-related outer membrane protein [Flavobacteriales bacterium]